MARAFDIIQRCVLMAIVFSSLGWLLWRVFKRSSERTSLVISWIITVLILGGIWYESIIFKTKFQQGDRTAVFFIFYTLVAGLVLAILWVPAITGFVGETFASFFDGGRQEVEAKPYYSVFRSKRAKGKYFEALAEVRRQLDKFSTDFEGHMLLAELQAQNLNDLPGAEITVQKLCAQPEHSLTNISYALNQLADWHLDLTRDREAAQRILERIIEIMPDTEMSLRAAQRIGHLASAESLLASHDRKRVEVGKGVRELGLLRGADGRLKAPEVDQEKVAAEYVEHLKIHPLDTHAREKLAVIYAKHYQRLDLAMDQLEQMIEQPGHAARKVVAWLNLMADLQVNNGAKFEDVQATLQRIIDIYPDIAAAQTARRRMDILRLEMKANDSKPSVHLGTYEQEIGLRKASPSKL